MAWIIWVLVVVITAVVYFYLNSRKEEFNRQGGSFFDKVADACCIRKR